MHNENCPLLIFGQLGCLKYWIDKHRAFDLVCNNRAILVKNEMALGKKGTVAFVGQQEIKGDNSRC